MTWVRSGLWSHLAAGMLILFVPVVAWASEDMSVLSGIDVDQVPGPYDKLPLVNDMEGSGRVFYGVSPCEGQIDYPHISRSAGSEYIVNTHMVGRCRGRTQYHTVEGAVYRERWWGVGTLEKRDGSESWWVPCKTESPGEV